MKKIVILIYVYLLADVGEIMSLAFQTTLLLYSLLGLIILATVFYLLKFISLSKNKVPVRTIILMTLIIIFILVLIFQYNKISTNLGLLKFLYLIFLPTLFFFFSVHENFTSKDILFIGYISLLIMISKSLIIVSNYSIIGIIGNPIDYRFLYSSLVNPIYLSKLASIVIIIFLSNISSKKAFKFITIAFSTFILLITFSRGPILSMFFVIVFFLLAKSKNKLYKFLLLGFSVIILLISYNGVIYFLTRGNADFSFAGDARIQSYLLAIDLFKNNLFLGVGLGNFSQYSILGYPHNLFFEILAELGILGLIYYSSYILLYFFNRKSVKQNKTLQFLIIFLSIFAMFSANITNTIVILPLLILGINEKKGVKIKDENTNDINNCTES